MDLWGQGKKGGTRRNRVKRKCGWEELHERRIYFIKKVIEIIWEYNKTINYEL